jgi:hypothetical protein
MNVKLPDRNDDTVPPSHGQLAICGVELSCKAEISARVTEIDDWIMDDGYTPSRLQADSPHFALGAGPVPALIRSELVEALKDMREHSVVLSGYLADHQIFHVNRPPRLADEIVNRVEITIPLHWSDAFRKYQRTWIDIERFALKEACFPMFLLDFSSAEGVSLLNGHQLVRIEGHMERSPGMFPLVIERVTVIRDDIWTDPAWTDAPWSATLDGHPVANAFTVIGQAAVRNYTIGAYTLVDVYSQTEDGKRRRHSVWMPTVRTGLLDKYKGVPVRLDGILGPTGSLHVDQPPQEPDGRDRRPFELRLEGYSRHAMGMYIVLNRGYGEDVVIKYTDEWNTLGIETLDYVSVLLEDLADDPEARWKPILGGIRKAMPGVRVASA